MLSFKNFLLEKIVSKKDAVQKLKSIAQGAGEIPTSAVIPNVGMRSNPPAFTSLHDRTEPKAIKKDPTIRKELAARVQRIPLDKVVTSQGYVGTSEVERKIKGTKRNDPPVPMFLKTAEGKYIARDGNHRTVGRKLRNFTHTRGVVVDEE